jgi:hypothetical protein
MSQMRFSMFFTLAIMLVFFVFLFAESFILERAAIVGKKQRVVYLLQKQH